MNPKPLTIFRVACLVAAILVGLNPEYISFASASTPATDKNDSPHRLLESGDPDAALRMMKTDPGWVSRLDNYQRTPLHVAARYGHVNVVQWLLDNGADVNAEAYNRFTPLHVTSDAEVVALILKHKPDLTIRSRSSNQTPLQHAATELNEARNKAQEKQWRAITQSLLDAGAEYDVLVAIRLGDLNRVKTFLSASPELADKFQGKSPLRVAASLGHTEICHYLIQKHKVDVDAFEQGNGYPIIKDALAHPDVVRLLIDSEADLKKRITWQGGRTGIWIIGNDATALHFAARDGVPESIDVLIDSGIDIMAFADSDLRDSKQQTALHVAAFFGQAENAKAILQHPQFEKIDSKVRQNLRNEFLSLGAIESGLGWGSESDRYELVKLLLDKGADPNAFQGQIAQRVARQIHPNHESENTKSKALVSLLLNHGAKLDMFTAVAIGDESAVAQLLKADPQSANSLHSDGYPALHFAVGMNYIGIVKQLLTAGCDVDIRSKNEGTGYLDQTALHCAAFWGRDEIAKLLIEAGADVNALTKRKSTPLHGAARMTNMKMVDLLLKNGAAINATDEEGKTPLDWCRRARDSQNSKAVLKVEQAFRTYQEKTKRDQ